MPDLEARKVHAEAETSSPAVVDHARRRRRRRWASVAVALAVLALGAWALHARTSSSGRASAQRAAATAARPVPVVAQPVARRDLPIYLEGLGSVTAFQTVTVKAQVDGRLDQVLFREGEKVRRGQVLAQIDPRPFLNQLHQAEGALARDQAQLRNVRVNVERDRQLAAERLIAQQQLDADVAASGQLEGAVRMDEAAIEAARLNLQYARITSPIDGVTGIRLVDPGNVVHPSDQNGIVIITQLDPIAVLFTLPQDELTPVLQELQRHALEVEVFSRDGATSLGKGQLALVDNQINQTTSTIRLKAIVPNPRRLLWPNQFVNARLHLTTREGALVIPAAAVQRGPAGTFVFVVGADDAAAARPIELGAAQGDLAVVTRGLQDGDRVVVEGQNQLRPGSKVVLREPGSAPGRPAGSGASPAPGSASTR
ncbi:MAG TPA: efflux RND transporter periplasmic adaptor subunit [Anaeromyxobacteraceae bacterium]|nr:efflux RND transporter periplasmic adaptor subunit [Anaeromyxobacteraceae bacterium]